MAIPGVAGLSTADPSTGVATDGGFRQGHKLLSMGHGCSGKKNTSEGT